MRRNHFRDSIGYQDWLGGGVGSRSGPGCGRRGADRTDLQLRDHRPAEGRPGQRGAAGVVGRCIRLLLRRRFLVTKPRSGALLPRGRRRLGVDHAVQRRPDHPVPRTDRGIDAGSVADLPGDPYRNGSGRHAGAHAVSAGSRGGLLRPSAGGLWRFTDLRAAAARVHRHLRRRPVPVLRSERDHGHDDAARSRTTSAGR